MSTDSEYTSFLTSANKTPLTTSGSDKTSSAPSTAQSKSTSTDPSVSGDALPESLHTLVKDSDASHRSGGGDGDEGLVYVSETDSPFEPLVLNYAGDEVPDAEGFAKCVKVEAGDVEALETGEWDARGRYGRVVDAVRAAGGGDGDGRKGERSGEGGEDGEVRVYRVARGSTRCEYFVVAVRRQGVGRSLVGVKVRAVES